MRRVNEMFHIEGEQLIKTSNGQAVPEDEPVFILRARDANALPALDFYLERCRKDGTPADRMAAMALVRRGFDKFAESNPDRMKRPGSTHGR